MIRGAIYFLWLALSVVPYGVLVVILSFVVKGDPLYWTTVGWLRQMTVAARRFALNAQPRKSP